jgi:nucleotide-binding universal stress UspA family protein
MSDPILVGVDTQKPDAAPLHLAARLAQITGAPLIAVAAYTYDPIMDARTGAAVGAELRDEAVDKLAELTEGIEAQRVVAAGRSPARALHDVAAESNAALLVVGSTRRGPIGRLAPGSTAERLLHGTSCPVAVATSDLTAEWRPARIGAGFIDLDEGRAALRAAAALAAAAGAALKAVTAVEPIVRPPSAVVQPYAAPSVDVEAGAPAARQSLETALAALPVKTESDVVVGDPADALIALSNEVDLLVCGSRGYGPLRAVLLGGVTHRVMRAAHCPVMILPRGTVTRLERLVERQNATTT